MEALTKLSYKHQQPLLVSPHPYKSLNQKHSFFSSISFRNTPISRPCSISSLKIKAFNANNNNYNNPRLVKPKNPFSILGSILKTPISIAITATALFLYTQFGHSPLLAIASPIVENETLEEEQEEVGGLDEKGLEDRVASNPNDIQSLKLLMECKIKKKKLPEAVEVINKLIEVEPNDSEWPLLRAHMYSYMGEQEIARTAFEELLSKDPLRVEAFHGLVMAVSQGGEEEGKELTEVAKRVVEAMEKCRREGKKEDVRDFKLLIAQIWVIEGNYNEALRVYQELVKEEPRDFRPYLCQGIIYTLLRKKDEAAKQFEKYQRLVPKGHPYAKYFDDNMLATKVFSQMAENERVKVGSKV